MNSVPLLVLLCCSLLEGQTVRVSAVTLRQHEDQENEIQTESSRDTTSTQQSCQPDLHSVLREMSAMLAELKVELRHTTTAVNNIETSLRDTQSQVEELKMKSEKELKDLKTAFENQVEILKKENQDLKTSFENQVEILKKENQERKVAFSASLSGGEAGYRGPYNTPVLLVYKHVFTNIGNAYNPATGIFTAPVRGVYQFRFTIHGGGSTVVAAFLEKNGHHVAETYARQPQSSVSSSNGVSLMLEVGDVVCIKLGADRRVYDDGFHYTTFSGEMLFPV